MLEDDNKCDRKRKRFVARLKSSKGIICTNLPSSCIVLCNVGQATGFKKDFIHNFIETSMPHIPLPKFIAEKGETHSYLVFNNTENAEEFLKQYNCNTHISGNGTPVYMNFVENVPNTEVICNHENPKGLLIINDFITIAEEKAFLKIFDRQEDEDLNNLKNRKVKHYGYEFRYGSNDVDLSAPLDDAIPPECDVLWHRLKEHGIDQGRPDQLTVNKYLPGQGIPSHVDKHSPFGDTILSVSLGAAVVMDWRHHTGKHVPVEVPARSLLVMQDEARYDWQHGIQPRTYDPIIQLRSTSEGSQQQVKVITEDTNPRGVRLSLTFRWIRTGPCECKYKTLCDSVQGSEDIEDAVAMQLEDLHVHQVYEQIACHFSTTRHTAWPRVAQFMRAVPPGSLTLDLGCGNGKNILPRNDILQVGGERSAALARECAARLRRDSLRADCVRLDLAAAPLRDACADAVICVAVIHHFSTRSRRLQAICNIARLLRRGGRCLVTVWSKDQTRSNYLLKTKEPPSEETRVPVAGIHLPVHENRTQFRHQDLLVPWKLRNVNDNKLESKGDNTLLRYYHVFEEGELDELCEKVPELLVEESFYEEGNWCVICS